MTRISAIHAVALAGATAAAFVLFAGTSIAKEKLAVSVWGGGYAESWKKHVADRFEAETGVEIVMDTGRSSQRLSKLLTTGGKGTDVVLLTDYQMAILRERGLLQPVDFERIDNIDQLYDFARDPFGGGMCPAFTVLGAGLAYNRNHFASPPDSWNDLFRDDLPGSPGFPHITQSYAPLVLIRLAELRGGGADDIDPGFARLATIKDRIEIFRVFEVLTSINQGDASVSPMLNIFVRKDPSVPLSFAWPADGGVGVLNMICVTRESASPELAAKFIDFYLSHELQRSLAVNAGDSPVRRDVDLPSDLPYTIVTPEQISRLHFYDAVELAASREQWLERFQEEIVAE